MKHVIINTLVAVFFISAAICHSNETVADDKKIGIIGLDTSHAIAFTKDINGTQEKPGIHGYRVVVAYPEGSPDIQSSVSRVPKYMAEMKGMGVEIVPSIAVLLENVDYVLLETNDGRPHLEQVLPVIAAGKPVFIDKPLASRLSDCLLIYAAAKKANVPVFSSSSLRFSKNSQAVRGGSIGEVQYCETSSPCSLEKTHPDLFWYGIHGVESLFTVMGIGCETVQRRTENDKIVVEGTWKGGRTGIYREGSGYSGSAQGTQGKSDVGAYDGYRPLVEEILEFFSTGRTPVGAEETIEIYAFMEAADESKRQGGKEISVSQMIEKAQQEVATQASK